MLAVEQRGHAPIETVSESDLRKAAASLLTAMAALEKAVRLDSADPTPYACVMPALTIFSRHEAAMKQAFLQATSLAPELAPLLAFGQASAAPSGRPS
jgi:hypothetical protein